MRHGQSFEQLRAPNFDQAPKADPRIQVRIPAVAMSHFANTLLKHVPDAEQREKIADDFALMLSAPEATAFRFIAGLPQKS